MYQLVAILTFARKHNNRKSIVLATGTHDLLCKESKRWRKVAAVWAREQSAGAKIKPVLRIELVEL